MKGPSISVSKFKKYSILSVHVLWAFLLSSAVFLYVVLILIGQTDPAITHDSTDLTGLVSPYLLGEESPGAMTRARKCHFCTRAKVLRKSQP